MLSSHTTPSREAGLRIQRIQLASMRKSIDHKGIAYALLNSVTLVCLYDRGRRCDVVAVSPFARPVPWDADECFHEVTIRHRNDGSTRVFYVRDWELCLLRALENAIVTQDPSCWAA